jgi:hypothetical protein
MLFGYFTSLAISSYLLRYRCLFDRNKSCMTLPFLKKSHISHKCEFFFDDEVGEFLQKLRGRF